MANLRGGFLKRFLTVLACAMLAVDGTSTFARADLVADGVACLAEQQADTGVWGDPSGSALRDTAVVVSTLRTINQSASEAYLDGLDGLLGLDAPNSDFLARQIAVLVGSGVTMTTEIDELLANQRAASGGTASEPNYPEGGWGVTSTFGTDSLTTGLALTALRTAGLPVGLTVASAVVTSPTQNVHPFTFPAGGSGLSILVRGVTGTVRLFIQTPSSGTFFIDLANISSPSVLSGFPQEAGNYELRVQSQAGSPNTYSFEVQFQTPTFDPGRVTRALAYLAAAQNGDGSWGLRRGEGGLLTATSEVLQTLLGFGSAFAGPTVIAKGLDWLEDLQHDDGGFGQDPTSTVYETALALATLGAGARTSPAIVNPARAYLAGLQGGDGCWNNADPYSTALALGVLFSPDDGLFCNGLEICNVVEGCSTIDVPICDDGVSCTTDACSEDLDECTTTPVNVTCNDGVFCNGEEICDVAAGCVTSLSDSGSVIDCDDHVTCTTDACSETTDSCTHVANNAACSDGVFCNGAEVCSVSDGCQTAARDCSDAFPCTTDGCDETGDTCTHAPNDAACADSNVCSDDICNIASGCTHPNNTAACDDGDVCTSSDVCSGGQCTGTDIPNCPTTTTTTIPEGPLCGDFNGSGSISAVDALGALRTAVQSAVCALAVCDYNGNGLVTAGDALAILKVAVGIPVTPNCPPSMALVGGPGSTTTTTLDQAP